LFARAFFLFRRDGITSSTSSLRKHCFRPEKALALNDDACTPLPSRTDIGKRFGFSRTQIGNIIAEGESLGFFEVDATGAPSPTARLHERYGGWISIELAFYARHVRPAR
jgi:hypothetical protein